MTAGVTAGPPALLGLLVGWAAACLPGLDADLELLLQHAGGRRVTSAMVAQPAGGLGEEWSGGACL